MNDSNEFTVGVKLNLASVALSVVSGQLRPDYLSSPAGQSFTRLCFERRLVRRLFVSVAARQWAVQAHLQWLEDALNVMRGLRDGVVWMRDDAVLNDYAIADRLSHWWLKHPSLVVKDANDQTLLWAISRAAIEVWLRHEINNGPSQSGPDSPGAFTKQAMDYLSQAIATAQALLLEPSNRTIPRQQAALKFPADLMQATQAAGVDHTLQPPLAVSCVPAAQTLDAWLAAPPHSVHSLALQAVPVPASTAYQRVNGQRFVLAVATREPEASFHTDTATGLSLNRLKSAFGHHARLHLFADNKEGLPKLYNHVIDQAGDDDVVVFMHDDLWLDDHYMLLRLQEALTYFDVVGVAGNRNRLPHQPAWLWPSKKGTWDTPANMLGRVAHPSRQSRQIINERMQGTAPSNAKDEEAMSLAPVSAYGASMAGARLMDGVLLCAKAGVLKAANVRFDTRFGFHFYDLDFCRQCEAAGLRMGVYPLALTHLSPGGFNSPAWYSALGTYTSKWGD